MIQYGRKTIKQVADDLVLALDELSKLGFNDENVGGRADITYAGEYDNHTIEFPSSRAVNDAGVVSALLNATVERLGHGARWSCPPGTNEHYAPWYVWLYVPKTAVRELTPDEEVIYRFTRNYSESERRIIADWIKNSG